MRPLITSLLILVILLAGGYLFVERILIHALDNQLTAAGIELQRIDDLDVSNTGVSIGAISLASAEWRVSGDQLTILLGREGELFVSARSLQFDLTPNQAGPVESEPLTIEALLQSVEDSMADMPHRGLVEQMRYCQPGVCVDFTLQWRRVAEAVVYWLYIPEYRLWLSLEKDEDWHLEVVSSAPETFGLLTVESRQGNASLSLQSEVFAQLQQLNLPQTEIEISRLELSGLTRLPLTATLDELLGELVSNHRLTLDADVAFEQEPLSVTSSGAFEFDLGLSDQDLVVQFHNLPEIQVSVPEFDSAGTIRLLGSQLCQVSLGLMFADCVLEEIESSWDVTHNIGTFAGDVEVVSANIEYGSGDIAFEAELQTSWFDLSEGLELVSGRLTSSLRQQELMISTHQGQLLGAPFQLDANYQLAPGAGQLTGGWRSGDRLGVAAGYGAARLDLGELARELSAGLAGGFDLETNIQWQGEGLAQLTQSSNLTLTPLSLSFDGYELREGELAVDVEGYPQLKADIRFSAAEINVGVPLSDFQTQMLMLAHTESGDVAVSGSHLNLKVLGGEVRAEDYSYALPSGDGQAELQLESIQLPELLALQQQKFESMGVLSGSVPVQLIAGNLSVTNASIGALAPGGYIRYEAEPSVRELAASNAGVAVVLDAMENFEYHTLDASVDYNADGQMFARTSIKGANPDYQGGREVHLNLNLEENILVLLRSLRLGSDIAEQIGEKRGR